KSDARLARALVDFDPRHALIPYVGSRHDALRCTDVPKQAGVGVYQYLADFHGCVSYFTHRRVQPGFLAFHDVRDAALETRSGDAPSPSPGRSSEFGTDDKKKLGPLSWRSGRKALVKNSRADLTASTKVIESHSFVGWR